MSLAEYRHKRDFKRTAEPSGTRGAKQGHRFVVQKHAASHLHYDFRLEMDGTLKSWAVPKGPSLDPKQKRLAIEVEDHPIGYADFEGTIPAGEYGGGTVMVWDKGTWSSSDEDPEQAYQAGRLKFSLDGEKLQGSSALVRTSRGGRKAQWLLIKHQDDAAKPTSRFDILEKMPDSAASGRTLEEIAEGAPAHRKKRAPARSRPSANVKSHSETKSATSATAKPERRSRKTLPVKSAARTSPPRKASARVRAGHSRSRRAGLAKLPGAQSRGMPKDLKAELATLVPVPPEGKDWLHEIKFDGYRMFCRVEQGTARMFSRNGQDWTARLQSLAQVAAQLPAKEAILDGEVVVLDAKGVSQFQLLQNAMGNNGDSGRPILYAFDLIYLDGYDLTRVPLETRKSLLEAFLEEAGTESRIRYSEHVLGSGKVFQRQACEALLEGIISKRRDSPYTAGRALDWLKCKCRQTQEFVIGGYTTPLGARTGFGSLLLGYYSDAGKFQYAGRVGTGFDARGLQSLTRQLKKLEQTERPFAQKPPGATGRTTRWVRPELVAQIEFSNWTEAGILRQPSFQGLREDKPARDVRAERPVEVESLK